MAFAKDFSLVAGSSFVNLAIGLVTTPLITRMVEPTDYGNWSLFNVFSGIAYFILMLGMDQVLVRYFYSDNEIERKQSLIFKCWFYTVVSLLFSILPIVYGLKLFSFNWSLVIFICLFFNILSLAINRLNNLILRFDEKISSLSIYTIIHKLAFVILAILFVVKFNDDFFALTCATLSSTIVIIGLGIFQERKFWKLPKKPFCFDKDKEYLSYGLPLMFASSVYLLFQATDKFTIKYFCSDSELGIYASASSILALLVIIQNSFNTVWWPTAMKKYQYDDNRYFFVKANETITLILVILGVSVSSLKDYIILFLGTHYRSAADLIPFIIFQPIMYTLSETTVVGLTFMKKSKVQLLITILSLVVNIIVSIFLTYKWGIIGTSVAVGVSYTFFFICRTIISQRFYKIPYSFYKMFISLTLLFGYSLYTTICGISLVTWIIALMIIISVSILYKQRFNYLLNTLVIFIRRKF